MVLSHEFDPPEDAGVKCREVFGGNSVFENGLAANLPHLVVVEEGLANLESGDVARAGGRHVPVARDLRGILLVEDGIEDRL